GDDAEVLRALHDLLRNRRAADRRADERVGAFGHMRHLELAVALRRVPVRLALLQLAARGLEYSVALAPRVGGRENEDLRLCHAELLSIRRLKTLSEHISGAFGKSIGLHPFADGDARLVRRR